MDGGATNALRRGTPQELADADSVVVELAHGSVELKQHALTGTILTEHAVEPIVPLRGLIDLGFVIKWSTHGCEIKHPSRGTIQCWLRNGCPVLSEKHALGLIHDIESLELAKRIPSESPETVSEAAHEWWVRGLKLQGPTCLGIRLNGTDTHKLRRLSFTCLLVKHLRLRRRDDYLGRSRWSECPRCCNLGLSLAIGCIWSCHSCIGGTTLSYCEQIVGKTPGPPRLRSRNGPERFGYEHINESQQQKTDSDTALYLKQLGLYMHMLMGLGMVRNGPT